MVKNLKRKRKELEKEGIIYRRQGLGTFVAEQGAARSRESKLGQARELIAVAAREAEEAGIARRDLPAFFQETLNQLNQS